jgi:methanogenic corrinoid protein MtbC1
MKQDEADREDLVPIGAAVEMLKDDYPDVSHSSLRFLEREGLVVPTRTPGGHRLYSTNDIHRIRQIKAWQEQRLSLEEIKRRLDSLSRIAPPAEIARAFLEHGLAGNQREALQVVLEASELGMPFSTLLMDVITPALHELGNRWETGAASVAQEKEVSALANELIAELTLQHINHLVPERGSVVAACVDAEEHELGLRIITALLRKEQIGVHFLGTAVAPEFLIDSVRLRKPDVILLSATINEHIDNLAVAINALREAGITVPVLAGGQAVQRNREKVATWGIEPADDDTMELVSRLVALAAGQG